MKEGRRQKIACIFILTLLFVIGGNKEAFAYGYITHIELMTQTFKALGNEFWGILSIHSLSALLGAIGPNFFWNKQIKKELHKDIFLSLPLCMAQYIKPLPSGEKREKLRAFLFGYLTHIAGDFHGHPLAHRLCMNDKHDWKFWQVFLHQDLYVGLKYHQMGKNTANIKINLYELDTDIVQMWYQTYQRISGAGLKLKDFMSNYDYTRFALWWLSKEIRQSTVRILLPYQPKRSYVREFDKTFEAAKNTGMELIKSTDEFLHSLEWERDADDKMRQALKNGYQLRCDWS